MIRLPPRSTPLYSSAASDVYKRQFDEGALHGVEEARGLRVREARRERDGRELRAVEDLVRVRVADSGKEGRVRQRALQRVVLAPEACCEGLGRRLERLEAARVERLKGLAPGDEPDPRPLLRARLGQEERPRVEIQRKEAELFRDRGGGFPPVQAPRDHEMQDEEEIFFERKHDSLAEPGHGRQAPAFHLPERWLHGAQYERARESDLPEHIPLQESLEVFDVHRDVRQLGHWMGE